MKPVQMLALSPVPYEGAGFRFRVAQYLPHLERAGFEVTASPFFTSEFFRVVYQPGRYAAKAGLFARRSMARLRELFERTQYDLYFVYREALPIGPPLIEACLAATAGRALVYDFDDAIYLPNASEANGFVSWLKYYRKVPSIIRASDATIAGNAYLAEYASAHNSVVTVIPTSVDTDLFVPERGRRPSNPPVVGWIGTHSTTKYLRTLLPLLARVAASHPFRLYVVGGDVIDAPGVDRRQAEWSLAREVRDFQSCDVGIYPLWDDAWARGKCGFKAIQFMACGVPVIAAAVGMNREVIEDGVNGFLAASDEEWITKLRALLGDPGLRRRLGEAGRRTVEERYSLRVSAPRLVAALRGALDRARRRH